MFFYLSKIIWFFVQPSSAILALAIAGAILLYTRWWRVGRAGVVAAVALFLLAGLSPLGQALILPLEQRFSAVAEPAVAPDGIIVLGGAFDSLVSPARGVAALNEAAERLTALVSLARRYPQAKLVFSGGKPQVFFARAHEADIARGMLADAGIAPERLILEDRSLNTFQNALLTKGILRPKASERWLLVTSAYHMPRAIGSFRRVGFPVTAYPVDYRTRGPVDLLRPFDKVSEGLRRVDLATREWVGLLIYWLTGRTSAFFPAP